MSVKSYAQAVLDLMTLLETDDTVTAYDVAKIIYDNEIPAQKDDIRADVYRELLALDGCYDA